MNDMPPEEEEVQSEEEKEDEGDTTATATKVTKILVNKNRPESAVFWIPYPSYIDNLERHCPPQFEVRPWDCATSDTFYYHGTRRYLYNAVKNVMKRAHATKTTKGGGWSLFWGRHLDISQYAALSPPQKVNHFPGSLELGRKDKLCTNILRMQRKFGSFYQIIPETYVTGGKDGKSFQAALIASPKSTLWILKPPNQCCGRGIKLISGGSEYKYEPDKRYVAQKYIMQPLLINGFKFDMRLYVLVTSYDPLRIYLFDNGLVRFCTEKYSTKDRKNRFGHLTNYSVNKKNKQFQSNQDAAEDGKGSKWSYQALQAYFDSENINSNQVHHDIAQVIIKTIMCVETPIVSAFSKKSSCCFELYGFDILLDAALRPWLLEVNVFPSMSSSSPMDKRIKTILVADTLQLVGLPAVDGMKVYDEQVKAKKEKALGLARRQSKEAVGEAEMDKDQSTQWLHDLEDEEARQGHFRRIFPTTETSEYLAYFEKARDSNAFYAKHLQKQMKNKEDKGQKCRRESFSEKLNQAKKASQSYDLKFQKGEV